MTLSSHKIYGPKGIAGLYIKKSIRLAPIIFGGSQQYGLRPGTENVPGVVGFAEVLEIAEKNKNKEFTRVKKLRDKLEAGIFKLIPEVMLNGHNDQRLPNFLNVSILGIEGEAAVLYLDAKGIFCSTGSACNSDSLEPSHVLRAMGKPHEYAHGSLRFTLGKFTTSSDIDYVLKILPEVVSKLRKIAMIQLKHEPR